MSKETEAKSLLKDNGQDPTWSGPEGNITLGISCKINVHQRFKKYAAMQKAALGQGQGEMLNEMMTAWADGKGI